MESLHSASVQGLLFAGRCIALMAFTEGAAAWFVPVDSLLPEQMLWRAIFTLILAVLLLPRQTLLKPPSIGLLLLWSALCGISLLPGLAWVVGIPVLSGGVPQLVVATAALVFLFTSLYAYLAARFNDRRAASRVTLTTLLLSLTLPLWASPVAAVNGGSQWLVDTIVALCPVSYLAGFTEIDYLRGPWLYQHTAYGSLRFDYPSPLYTSILILLLAAFMSTRHNVHWPGQEAGKLQSVTPESLETKL